MPPLITLHAPQNLVIRLCAMCANDVYTYAEVVHIAGSFHVCTKRAGGESGYDVCCTYYYYYDYYTSTNNVSEDLAYKHIHLLSAWL